MAFLYKVLATLLGRVYGYVAPFVALESYQRAPLHKSHGRRLYSAAVLLACERVAAWNRAMLGELCATLPHGDPASTSGLLTGQANSTSMQVFVLGMHRSGTSALARVLNLMGLYFGGEEVGTGRSAENKKGFWERRDVRALNDAILFESGCDWDCLSSLNLDALAAHKRAEYVALATNIVMQMDAHRPWFVKEPRLCALFPIWRQALETPVCVHIVRNPLEVAESLRSRNGLPLDVGLALWEAYNVRALAAAAGVPRAFIGYDDLLRRPVAAVGELHEALLSYGYRLRVPGEVELRGFLDANMRRQRRTEDEMRRAATAPQAALYDQLLAADESTALAPLLSDDSAAVLRRYEATVDVDSRRTNAAASSALRSEVGLALQVAFKELDLSHANARIREANERARDAAQRCGLAEGKVEKLQRTTLDMRARLAAGDDKARKLERQRDSLAHDMQRAAQAHRAERRDEHAKLAAAYDKARRLERQRDSLVRESSRLQRDATDADSRRNEVRASIKRWDAELGFRKARIAELRQFADNLDTHLRKLLLSKRWRLGDALVSMASFALLRGRKETLQAQLARAADAHAASLETIATVADELTEQPAGLRRQADRTTEADGAAARARRDRELFGMLLERRANVAQRAAHTAALRRHVEALLRIADVFSRSIRWRVGDRLLGIPQRLMFRPPPSTAVDGLAGLAAEYRGGALGADLPTVPLDEEGQGEDNAADSAGAMDAAGTAKPLYLGNELWRSASVDVIVCVHNALEHVERCLASVLTRTTVEFRLIVVNDGSNEQTTTRLAELARHHAPMEVLQTGGPLGYTRAANLGLLSSSAAYVVLLNSDTIVPRLWVEGLLDAMSSGDNVGVVGPLSNAASWQSVPERSDAGGWKVNELPPGYNVDDFGELVHSLSARRFPRMPFLNGFCLMLRRSVIERVGLLDEDAFPRGYGEEDDYCLRVRNAGYELAVADHCYVYHAKSKSFGGEREELAQAGSEALVAKHGCEAIEAGTELARNCADLAQARKTIGDFLSRGDAMPSDTSAKTCDVLFLLPVKGASGGANSVVQEAAGMRSLGVDARVATHIRYQSSFARFYREFVDAGDLFIFYGSDDEFYAKAKYFDVIVATLWSTPALIAPFASSHPDKLYVYYVQDYEPWFFSNDPESESAARESYTLVPNMVLMAKTDWICRTVEERHGVRVHRVLPSLDHGVFFPSPPHAGEGRPVTVAAMVRPSTSRRAPLRTLRVLQAVTKTARADVRVVIFGCNAMDLESYIKDNQSAMGDGFDYENRGVVPRSEVSALLRTADIFIDVSDYQAFGRTGLEAMACGCAVLLPARGGVHEYAIHGENAVVVDTSSFKTIVVELTKLIDDAVTRRLIAHRGIETASRYGIPCASLSELGVFRQASALNFTGRSLDASAFARGAAPADCVAWLGRDGAAQATRSAA